MLRAVMRRKMGCKISGMESEQIVTLDFDAPELERALSSGGYGETGFEATSLVGVEILPAKKDKPHA
jgi:hypothetical protein